MSTQRIPRFRLAVVCVGLAFALAASLGLAALAPGNAYAEGKTSVWVVSQSTTKQSDGKFTTKYTYNKNGLVAKTNSNSKYTDDSYTVATQYTYSSKNALKKEVSKFNGKANYTVTYTADSKGRVTKAVYKYVEGGKVTEKYSYDSKGRLTKASYSGGSSKYTYNAKGYVVSQKWKSPDDTIKFSYIYDAKGYLKTTKYNGEIDGKFKNTYKNGRLVKRVFYSGDGTSSGKQTITYKKISVPKSLAKMVKAQQRLLIVGTLPFASAHK